MIVNLNKFVVSKVFNENGGKVTGTKLIKNSCYSRSENLFVIAIHDGNYEPERSEFNCRVGEKLNSSGNIFVFCRPIFCDQFKESWGDKKRCANLEEKYYPPTFSGKYRVQMTQKPDKLPVMHLNSTDENANVDSIWIELQTGGKHNNSNYEVEGEQPETLFNSIVRSGGGAHQSNLLVGVAPIGTIIRFFQDSYKSRDGNETFYYRVTEEGLTLLPIELADGLTLEDLVPPEE